MIVKHIQAMTLRQLSLLCLLVGLGSIEMKAQDSLPGGVNGLKTWFCAEVDREGNYYWQDRVGEPGEVFPFGTKLNWLNYNPAFSFEEGQNPITLPILAGDLTQATFISLHQAQDTFLERSIWSFAAANKQHVLLSTERMADLAKGKFLNFLDANKRGPVLNTYYQHLPPESKSSTSGQLRLGHVSSAQDIPVSPFVGLFPEFLVYDKVLSRKEQLRVNSYLAIKYGVTLQRSNYLNAEGKIIWNEKENRDYSHRIAGIARDDISGLLQKQAASQNDKTPIWRMGIGTMRDHNAQNKTYLPAATFLLWGDDNGRLRFPSLEEGNEPFLERKWLMAAKGDYQQLSTQLMLDVSQLELLVNPEKEMWLVIDRSGTGDFAFGDTEYYQAQPTSVFTDFVFDDIAWDTDGSGTDVFTLQEGTKLLAQIDLQLPSCSLQETGQLQLNVHGGVAPFHFEWYDLETKTKVKWTASDRKIEKITAIEAGEFRLTIKDAEQNEYQGFFSIGNQEMLATKLLASYELKVDERLVLDAGTGPVGTQYRWFTPAGEQLYSAKIEIEEAGDYLLEMEWEGCVSKKKILVSAAAKSVFKDFNLYPNPVSEGEPFDLRVQLQEPLPLGLKIMDDLGRLIHEQVFPSYDFFRYQKKLTTAGNYHLQLQAGKEVQTLKLVVQ